MEPPRIEYKGFKYKYNIKGDIVKVMFVRSNSRHVKLDQSSITLKTNSGFVLKKKQEPRSKFLNGPVTRTFKRKKVLTLFKSVVF